MIKYKAISIAAAITMIVGVISAVPAIASEVCPRGSLTEVQPELDRLGAVIKAVPATARDAMVSKRGNPPGIEDGDAFQLLMVTTPDGTQAQLIVVDKNDCITWAGPLGTPEQINRFLGLIEANA